MKNKMPVYGKDYVAGDVYFVWTDKSFLSAGIAWFEYREEFLKVKNKVSHCGIVVGVGKGISAQPQGIDYEDLDEIIKNENKHIFFREPTMLWSYGSKKIINYAKNQIGRKYDYGLFLGFAVINSTIGKLFTEKFKRKILNLFNSKSRLICSEFAAECLFYGGLSYYHYFKIMPSELMDLCVFKKLKYSS